MVRTTVHQRYGVLWMTGGDRYGIMLDMILEKGDRASILADWFGKEVNTLDKEQCVLSIKNNVSGIQAITVVGVIDGSFKDKLGTSSLVLENIDETERIAGLVEVPGHDDKHNAYIVELAGLFGWVVVVNILQKIGEVHNGEVDIGYDRLSTLQCSFWNGEEDISSG